MNVNLVTLISLFFFLFSYDNNYGQDLTSTDINDDPIFKIDSVDSPGYFPGCEGIEDTLLKEQTHLKLLIDYLYPKIVYPALALENKTEGMVVISFVVEKDGSLTNHRISRDIGEGCGEEALRVVKLFPNFEPSLKDGQPVRVQFHLPVRFLIRDYLEMKYPKIKEARSKSKKKRKKKGK